MKKNSLFHSSFLATSCSLSVLALSLNVNAATVVDMELSLLNDLSGSVNNTEYELLING